MKKIIALLLICAVMLMSITACAQSTPEQTGSSSAEQDTASAAQEQQQTQEVEYPTQPITFVVPWAAGGSTDIIGRAVAQVAEKKLGQPIVVENREGGNATIGTAEAANADADGYTVLVAAIAPTILQPYYVDVTYTPESFDAICQISEKDMVIVASADAPFDTMEEFIALCKENPDEYLFAVSNGNAAHLAFAKVMSDEEFTAKHYPSKGDSETITNVLGGVTDIGFLTGVSVAQAQIEAGELKALAVFSPERNSLLEDVPTLMEQGIDVSAVAWTGLLVPTGMPQETLQAIQESFEEVLMDAETKELLEKAGETLNYLPGDEFEEKMLADYASYGVEIEALGLAK